MAILLVFILDPALVSSLSSLVLQILPLSGPAWCDSLARSEERNKESQMQLRLDCDVFLSDWVLFSSTVAEREKLLGSLGATFSKTWTPKKTWKITGPMIGRCSYTTNSVAASSAPSLEELFIQRWWVRISGFRLLLWRDWETCQSIAGLSSLF